MQIRLLDEAQFGRKQEEVAGTWALFTLVKFYLEAFLSNFIDNVLRNWENTDDILILL